MRPFWIRPSAMLAVMLLSAACSGSRGPVQQGSPSGSPPVHGSAVNPANIKRVGRELPPDDEVSSGVPGAPRLAWRLPAGPSGFGAAPPECAILADPGNGRDQSAQGISGSGSGGIVDAVVVSLPGRPEQVTPDRDVVAGCGQWTMRAGRTTVHVSLTEAPPIEDAETIGMVADIRTSVESGTEIESRAYTFTAYLGDCYAFTTLTTDPGAAHPSLPPQFAADLLVKTVSILRS